MLRRTQGAGLGVEAPNLQGARNLHRATARMMRMERTAAEMASKFDTVHDSATPSPPLAAQATKNAASGHAAATGAGREAGDPPRGELDAVQGADVDVPETEESILDRKVRVCQVEARKVLGREQYIGL